jgi:hypothetical protein
MNQNAPCKLCGITSKLVRKSHIIPDFMYKGVPDGKNRMAVVDINDMNSKRIAQTGTYDKYILCYKCENELLGRLESYVAHLIYGNPTKKPAKFKKGLSADGLKSIELECIDYTTFKLGLLSILWKAHISSNPFFKAIDIGEFEPVIRKMLLNNDAGDDKVFRIAVGYLLSPSGKSVKLVISPMMVKIGECFVAVFIINSSIYFIEVGSTSSFSFFDSPVSLKKEGTLSVPLIGGDFAKHIFGIFGIDDMLIHFASS